MRAFRYLQWTVAASFGLIGLLFLLTFFEDREIPQEVTGWAESQSTPALATLIEIFALLGIAVGSIAMLARQRWGAWTHLVSNCCGISAGLFMKCQIRSARLDAVDSLLMLCIGLLYGLAFFTDALIPNQRPPNQTQSQPTGYSS